MPDGLPHGRGRVLACVLISVLLGLVALPASAASGDPQAQVDQAQAALQQARAQAQQQDGALVAAQQALAASQQQLARLQQRIADLDAEVAADDAAVARLQVQEEHDRATLADYVRASYQRGLDAPFLYIVASDSFSTMMQRQSEMTHVADAAQALVSRIASERREAQQTLARARDRRAQAQVAQQQAATTAALIAVEEQQVRAEDAAAWTRVQQARQTLGAAQQAKAAWDAAQAAAGGSGGESQKVASCGSSVVYPAIPGPVFTVDTALTVPSGETASRLDAFLGGTALSGLGPAFMQAEQSNHVSARYLLAHAIEESAWGTSLIAQDKHNLFGFGANDANPYGDAMSFPSFQAGIMFVSGYVASNYLSSNGTFYHGPTLRGMNVCYASDPSWAANIAAIADTIP